MIDRALSTTLWRFRPPAANDAISSPGEGTSRKKLEFWLAARLSLPSPSLPLMLTAVVGMTLRTSNAHSSAAMTMMAALPLQLVLALLGPGACRQIFDLHDCVRMYEYYYILLYVVELE